MINTYIYIYVHISEHSFPINNPQKLKQTTSDLTPQKVYGSMALGLSSAGALELHPQVPSEGRGVRGPQTTPGGKATKMTEEVL